MELEPDHGSWGRTPASDLGPAMTAFDFPLVVWELPADAVLLANDAATELFGLPFDRLLGSKGFDLGGPRDAVKSAVAALSSGAVDDVMSERRVDTPGGGSVPVRVWTRAFVLDGQRAALSMLVPVTELGRLSHDPAAPWRELAPVAVGIADHQWRIRAVSNDVRRVLGSTPAELVGSSLLDLIDPDDVRREIGIASVPSRPMLLSRCHVRFRHGDGSWGELCMLVAPLPHEGPGRIVFALIGPPLRAEAPSASDRVAELEGRLRHIAAHVRAAGVLDYGDALPDPSDFPQLGELTTRQWEVLSRLLQGERVPSIADALYLSQSTVRNHLAVIFKKFGVHSQADLIALLRQTETGHQDP